MKFFLKFFLLSVMFIFGTISAAQSKEFKPHSFQLYYGNATDLYSQLIDRLKPGQVVVVDSRSLSTRQMSKLLEQANRLNAKVLGYLSIGELHDQQVKHFEQVILKYRQRVRRTFPAHFGKLDRFTINRNNKFHSRRIDVLEESWRIYLFHEMQQIYQAGLHGLFLDTVDTVDLYISRSAWSLKRREKSVQTMKQLIRDLKLRQPEKFIMLNRGLNLIGEKVFIGQAVGIEIPGLHLARKRQGNPDFLLWENAWTGTDDWSTAKAKLIQQINAAGFCQVFTLGYKTSNQQKEQFYKKSREAGYLPAWASSSAHLHLEIAADWR